MQSVQRRFGKLLPRSADESQVSMLLKDFDDADKMLARLIDAVKAWRDSWTDILYAQHRLISDFQAMYSPIATSEDIPSSHEPVITPWSTMQRTVKLQEAYAELKIDLLEEVNKIDIRLVKPAMEAKDHIQPMKKIIKKREDRKLDYERYQGRVDSWRKKTKRSERDNISLEKAETDLLRAKEEYNVADDRLKSTLPPIITATYSLLPHLLAAQIVTQNALLSHYYTLLHSYCQEENFPSPPPPMGTVIQTWDTDFRPVQQEIETNIACVASGKGRRAPMKSEVSPLRNGYPHRRQLSGQLLGLKPPVSPSIDASPAPPSPDPNTRPGILSIPSQTSLSLSTPNYTPSTLTSPSPSEFLTPASHAPAGPRADYFSRDRLASTSSISSIASAKKKPPPPPPKRFPSANQGVWVTALYDFNGQGDGDLVFREGDRIRVTKKTESTDDWWEGELRGVGGSFPANYCQGV